ncbi:hypothetical protein G6F60_015539 [Rhizopus arrhizus]|nr:hypothetical protein G6F60_015539 [Rhizopus arrhizus]
MPEHHPGLDPQPVGAGGGGAGHLRDRGGQGAGGVARICAGRCAAGDQPDPDPADPLEIAGLPRAGGRERAAAPAGRRRPSAADPAEPDGQRGQVHRQRLRAIARVQP